MARKRYTPEQIIGMLREAEVRLLQGEKIGAIVPSSGLRPQYRGLSGATTLWRTAPMTEKSSALLTVIDEHSR